MDRGLQRALDTRGCVLSSPNGAPLAHAVWVADAHANELVVLALHAPTSDSASRLLVRAAGVAAAAGLARVRVWGPDEAIRGVAGVALVPRVGRLPMLHALSPLAAAAGWAHIQRGLWY